MHQANGLSDYGTNGGWLADSLSRCSSWPKLSMHYTEINNIMYAEKTVYK